MTIRELEPKLIWEQFDDITRVPRPSKKEEKIIAWLEEFAVKHGFEHETDATGNVVIRKAATAGYENRPAVILQSHMDMVCEKRSDVEFDFDNDPSTPPTSTNPAPFTENSLNHEMGTPLRQRY
jgi:dipeptidase D